VSYYIRSVGVAWGVECDGFGKSSYPLHDRAATAHRIGNCKVIVS